MATVTLEGVSKSFGASVAVKDFSVAIADSEFVTFLGPSGCGKTTCLRMVAGFTEPTAGRIHIGSRVVSDALKGAFVPPEERGVGMVFQSYAVWPHMTVYDNVAYPLKIKSVPKNETRQRVNRTLEAMKMSDLGQRYPHQLSGGQQQRVALARALVMNPQVLLLDEPLSNLDAKLREEMRIEIKQLQKETGVTIIFVTHDQLEAMVLADRIVVVNLGVIQQVGTARELYLNPANRFVAEFIGVANFVPCRRTEHGLVLAADPQVTLPIQPPSTLGAEHIVMMARPHDIEIHRREGQISARITQKIFVGDAIEYTASIGAQMVRVRSAANEEYNVGDSIYLNFAASHFFAA